MTVLSILMRNGLRRLTKNRNRLGNVVEDIYSRSKIYKVLRDKYIQVSPVIPLVSLYYIIY